MPNRREKQTPAGQSIAEARHANPLVNRPEMQAPRQHLQHATQRSLPRKTPSRRCQPSGTQRLRLGPRCSADGSERGERDAPAKKLQAAAGSLLNQAGSAAKNLWSTLQQRAAGAAAGNRPAPPPAGAPVDNSANAGSVHQDGQSRTLTFRATGSQAAGQAASELVLGDVVAMPPPTGGGSDNAAPLASWDAPATATVQGGALGPGGTSDTTGWGQPDFEAPAAAPRKLAGKLQCYHLYKPATRAHAGSTCSVWLADAARV